MATSPRERVGVNPSRGRYVPVPESDRPIYGPVSVPKRTPRHETTANSSTVEKEAQKAWSFESPKEVLGATQPGKDWAMAALHPCGEDAPQNIGIPDTITAAVVTPNYRSDYEISYDNTMFESPPTEAGTWSAQVISLPVPELAYVYRIRNDEENVWSNWRAVRTPGFTNPSTRGIEGVTMKTIGYAKHRIVAKGITFELNASDLNNQGRVISGQLESLVERHTGVLSQTEVAGGAPNIIEVGGFPYTQDVFAVPDTEGYLVLACPRAYEAEAKCGAYVVHKFDSPLVGYDFQLTGSDNIEDLDVTQSAGAATITPYLGVGSSLRMMAIDDPSAAISGHAVEWVTDSQLAHVTADQSFLQLGRSFAEFVPFVSPAASVLTSVTFFLGMPGANSTTTLAPTIRVKSRLFLECFSNGSPSVAPFVRPSPLRDMLAVDMVVGTMQTFDDAYPASYNGFGDILGSIWNGVQQVAGVITTGVKIAGDVAGALGPVLSFL